ncbi:MAG: hypothetical protein U0L88_13230, partial [Acutalibacteraceae bacterium]|nr:hypothetical protein [Acutalibacteraceae bacterium]
TSKQASEKLAELYSKESLTPQEKNDFNYLLGKTDSTTAKSYWERSKGEANEKWNDFSRNDELNLNSLEMTFPGAISAERDEKGKPIGYTLNVSELKNTYNLTDEDIKVITSKNGFVKSGEGKYYARLYGPKTNGFFKQVDYNNAASDAQEKKSIYEQLKWQEAVQPYIEEAKADPNYGSVPKQKYGKDDEYWLSDKSVWIADAIAGKADVSNYMNSMSSYYSKLPQSDSWGHSMTENTKRKEILGEYDRIGQMTDEEKDVFLLWYNKDKEKAMEFYENLAPVLDKRVYVAETKEAAKFAKEHHILANAGTVAKNIIYAPDTAGTFVQEMFNEEFNPYAPGFKASYTSEAIRGATAENINNPVWRFVYSTGMSMADSAAVMPMGGIGIAFLGANAAVAEGRKTAIEGGSKAQIFAKGIAAGAFEAFFEKVGLDNLFKPRAVGGLAKALQVTLAQGGIEASEELCTSIANNLIDDILMGNESQYNKLVKGYVAKGMSIGEAQYQAMIDMGGEVLTDTLAGFVSGMFFGAGGSAINYTNAVNTGKQVNAQGNKEALIDYAKGQDRNSTAYKDAVKLSDKKSVKNAEVGALLQQMIIDKQISEADARTLVTEGLNGAPLDEAEQAYYYAGARGIGINEAVKLNSNLTVDPDRAIAAWQMGAEKRKANDTARIRAGKVYTETDSKLAEAVEKNTERPKEIEKTKKTPAVQNGGNVVETPAVQNAPVKAVKFKGEAYEQAKAYKTEANAKDFEYAYTQGFNRVKPSEDINLEDVAISAAYLAGVSDSRTVVSSKANFESRTPGLNLIDTVSRDIATTLSDSTRATINNIGKKLGIEIRLTNKTNEIAGGNTEHSLNSSYNFKNGVVTINVDEIHIGLKGRKLKKNELARFILAHEGTHRLQETSPEAYAEMEKVALSKSNMTLEEYMKKWNISDEAEARGEIVADYFGDLLSTKAEVKALLNENRSLWDKILEVIDWLIYKLKGTGIAYNDIAEARELFRQALSEADATVWGKDVRSDESDVLSRSKTVDKKKKTSYYSYYNTEVMKWAYATNRKPGDLKILHNGKQHVLLEATADGYVELYKGKYKEVEDKYERMLRETDDSFYAYSKKIRSEQKRNMRDLQYDKDGRNDDKNAGQNGSERLQADTTGSNEHLRRSNKRESLTDDVLLSRSEDSEYLELAKNPKANEAKLREMLDKVAYRKN